MNLGLHLRNRYVALADVLLIVLAAFGSFALRLDVAQLPFYSPAILAFAIVALLVKVPVYYVFGMYRRLWIYASTHELKLISAAVSAASALTTVVMLLLLSVSAVGPGMPRSALGIDWLLSLVLIGGSRFALRIRAEGTPARPPGAPRRALVIGAGEAAALVVRELLRSYQLNIRPIGLLDDDPRKQDQQIQGVAVMGPIKRLPELLDTASVDEVIFAIPTAPGKIVRFVNESCRARGIASRTMPGIDELIGGRINVSRLREVQITDLLRREPVRVDETAIGGTLCDRSVLVTGAGGSIGRELTRQIIRWKPSRVVLVGHGENSIFEAMLELEAGGAGIPLVPVIADIRDEDRLTATMRAHGAQVVFHAAAHKHVPLMQENRVEAVDNNVFGTQAVVAAATAAGVDRLVFISTDKAVQPANVYGATKRIGELITLDAARRTGRAFSVVRFGNVLGSRGSVIPLFKQQIAAGGPVLVTHPDMERYFMTIPEAVHLVLQAASMGRGGEVFILEMGEQVRIVDLAQDLIRLSGLEPGRDIEIQFTGVRAGEKLREDLREAGKTYVPTAHPDIRVSADCDNATGIDLHVALAGLREALDLGKSEGIVAALGKALPDASISDAHLLDLTAIV